MYRGSTDERANCREFKLFADGNKIMEEETYEVTGDVQAQKNAIYEQWLDGAYERIGATAKVLLPAVQSVAQTMGSLTVTDFTARGL